MSRNSIEKRSTLGEKNWLNRSRCNPESATFIPVSHNLPDRFNKFQQSNVSIRNLGSDESSLENRYQTLHKLYKGLMAKTGIQNQNVNDQSKQIARLQQMHDNHQKQIRRLRGMLGFLHKQNKQTQTRFEDCMEPKSPKERIDSKGNFNISKFSNHSSKQQPKIITKINTTNYESQVSIRSPNYKSVPKPSNERVSRSSKYLHQAATADFYFKKQQRCRSPGLKEKFKFIPSLPLA